ncbi:alpha/beta fold hydrolase [Vibrio sp. YIC-376]|uniref:alpha/beta fold hydrolase n=1 Tax=Vibrio sp. YIC-376 TaxID=3136162 RepID=UPI00402A6FD4
MVPIVLVRGLVRESGHWQSMLYALKQASPELVIITPNVLGNGEKYRELSPLNIEQMLSPMLKQLPNHCHRYHLVAISMGSMLASHWAHTLPNQVASLTLINPSFSRYSPFWHRININALLSIGASRLKGSDAFQKSIIKWTSPICVNQPEVLEHHIKLARQHPVSVRNAIRQLCAAAQFKGQSSPPACPSQIIVSTADKLVDSRCGEAIAKAWQVEISRFDCDAHDLPLAKPHELSHHLLHWLARVELLTNDP